MTPPFHDDEACTHPDQPLYVDNEKRTRFHGNKIVRQLLTRASKGKKYDLNDIGEDIDNGLFAQDDVDQFWQLLDYPITGYLELSCISDEAKDRAQEAEDAL